MDRSNGIFLETADFLGTRLCRDAIWAGDRCNWVGPAAIELNGGVQVTGQRACGADLYSGTTGLAAFLARLYASTGEKIFSFTAEGAMRQALSRLDDFAFATRIGFYTGLTGIAYVLVELSEILDVGKFAAMALLLLEEVGNDDLGQQNVDVFSGSAGAIPALLKIHRKQPKDFLLELAVKHGEHLLDAGREDSGLGQDGRTIPHRVAGLARGADGIAWALLELYHSTGQDRFREAARQAFRQELHSFPSRSDDRPDSQTVSDAQATWFEGASGIGMTRLRAFELLGDEIYLDQAKEAIRTVSEVLPGSSSITAPKDFSLAHGLAGEAELLLGASRAFKDESYQALAERIGRRGIDYYRNDDLPWPCGAPQKLETPNLMLGLAGIGYFYLRLHDALQTPSLLMVLPDSVSVNPTGMR